MGLIVGVICAALTERGFLQSTNRAAADFMMRQLARERLSEPLGDAPRLVYIDISEETCERWAEQKQTACSLGMVTPRDLLANLLRNIADRAKASNGRARLVVVDVDLAPLPHPAGQANLDPADAELCAAINDLVRDIPVITVLPMTIAADPAGKGIRSFQSVLTAAPGSSPCINHDLSAGRLWLASPLLQPDPDGVIRSVHAWDTVRDAKTNDSSRIAGIGLLGAALLQPHLDVDALVCSFPGSSLAVSHCQSDSITVGTQRFLFDTASHTDRILFLLPSEERGQEGPAFYGYAPSVIDTIDATELASTDGDRLGDAVVVVGGSYLTSGDLHVTPLGADMPGAMVHANAIRAYATSAFVQEHGSLVVEVSLTVASALIGTCFCLLRLLTHRWSTRGQKPRRVAGAMLNAALSLIGVLAAVLIVYVIGSVWAFDKMARTGGVLATVTPALAVAFEGVSGIVHEIRQLLQAGLLQIEDLVRARASSRKIWSGSGGQGLPKT
jgi:CHASE2 domain-containing sensor protein